MSFYREMRVLGRGRSFPKGDAISQKWSKIVFMERMNRIWTALRSLPVLLSAVGMSCLLLAGIFIVLGLLAPAVTPPAGTTALTVIPGATATPYVPTATPTRIPTATSDRIGAPLPGVIGIGSTVQISGTEGTGLNIRSEPGLGTAIRFVALDSEVFEVRDGPQVVDDFTWWYLVTPLDESRTGWAAADFLSLVSPEN